MIVHVLAGQTIRPVPIVALAGVNISSIPGPHLGPSPLISLRLASSSNRPLDTTYASCVVKACAQSRQKAIADLQQIQTVHKTDEASKAKLSIEVVTKEASTKIAKEEVIQILITFKQVIRYGIVNQLYWAGIGGMLSEAAAAACGAQHLTSSPAVTGGNMKATTFFCIMFQGRYWRKYECRAIIMFRTVEEWGKALEKAVLAGGYSEVVLMNDEDVSSYIVFGYYSEGQEVDDVYAPVIGDAKEGINGNQMIQYEGIYLASSPAASALSASIIGY
ncbi:hypothetical protein Tco_0785228 [Tanacetum coccineum]